MWNIYTWQNVLFFYIDCKVWGGYFHVVLRVIWKNANLLNYRFEEGIKTVPYVLFSQKYQLWPVSLPVSMFRASFCGGYGTFSLVHLSFPHPLQHCDSGICN